MKVLSYLDNVVANNLLLLQKENKNLRPHTDKLTGSMLGKPLQEQILKIIGVPQKNFDPYVLRKFERGHHVEAWIASIVPGKLSAEEILELGKTNPAVTGVDDSGQAELQYRGATGHVDLMVDMSQWEEPQLGIIPHEVKSITNANWNRKFGGRAGGPGAHDASWGHKLQIGLYALALSVPTFVIHYVASDDYRIKSFLIQTSDIAKDVNDIITEVHDTLALGVVPDFVARESWQENVLYQDYPAWSGLTAEQATEKVQTEYPEAYEKLLSFAREGVN